MILNITFQSKLSVIEGITTIKLNLIQYLYHEKSLKTQFLQINCPTIDTIILVFSGPCILCFFYKEVFYRKVVLNFIKGKESSVLDFLRPKKVDKLICI